MLIVLKSLYMEDCFMKKIIALIICVCLNLTLLLMYTPVVNAETENCYTYSITNGEAIITAYDKYNGVKGELIIPSTLGGCPVTEIGDRVFKNNNNITDVVIPNTVKKIGEAAFAECGNLENIVIPPSLQSTGNDAFKNTDIKKVYITDLAAWCNIKFGTNISGYGPLCRGYGKLYLNNTLITELKIPEGVTSIQKDAFRGCDSIISVVLPKSITSISNAFSGCTNIKDVWYLGSESAKANISIDNSNSYLLNAEWHYDSCPIGAEHTYSTICDAECNVCDYVREGAEHSFTNYISNKDATCQKPETETAECDNQCGATDTREIENSVVDCKFTTYISDHNATCKNDCTETAKCDYDCGKTDTRDIKDSKLRHSYSDSCDTICNLCGDSRKIIHSYKTIITKATTSKNGSIVKKCTECGNVASKTTLKYAKTFKLSTTSYTYNGKAKKPTVKVYNSDGKLITDANYTVTYKNNKNVGTATVTIKFKKYYSGTKTLTFKINPKSTTVSKLTAGKKSLKVNIKKQSSQTTGYQIQYSTSKKFTSAKTKTISSYKTTSVTIKSLKAKKTYYVRVRTYKVVDGKKYYSDWSSYKSKKTK